MLKQRLITAAILIPLVVWGVLAMPTPMFAITTAVLAMLGHYEWSHISGLSSKLAQNVYLVGLVILFCGVGFWVQASFSALLGIVVVSQIWWLSALFLVVLYPRLQSIWAPIPVKLVIGPIILIPCWLALVAIHASHEMGPQYVLYLLILIWVADSAAYFGGRRWGSNKLAPKVSPGKSWEGALSGLAAVALFAVLASYHFNVNQLGAIQVLAFVLLSVLSAIYSVLGDLTESMFKRQAGVKDSGTLLPGHGGILDRIDSITAAAPIFFIGLWWLSDVTSVSLIDQATYLNNMLHGEFR